MKQVKELKRIQIVGVFGSKFQEEKSMESLRLVLMGWLQFWESRHKGNSLEVRIINPGVEEVKVVE